MSHKFVIVMVLVTGAALWPFATMAAKPQASTDASDASRAKLSYALGYEAGLDLGNRQLDVDIATVLRGVQDGYSHSKPRYSPQTMREAVEAMQRKMIAEARVAYTRLAAANLAKARQFFSRNKAREGVVTLPSGVQYKVLDGGQGDRSPTIDSKVTLQYRGEFLDGTVFDNTEDRGKPVVFPVNQMIPGWRDIITRMHVGDHWQVFIPPDQAYGVRGEPPRIGPNEALVFDIQLLGIKP